MKDAMSKAFYSMGAICSIRQWEVIFTILTISTVMISFVDWEKETVKHEFSEEYIGLHVIIMNIMKFLAVVYTCKQFKTIYQLGSSFILGFAVLLVLLSSFVYFCSVMMCFNMTMPGLKDSFFIFFLIIDLDKTSYLSRCALKSASYSEVKMNIAEAISHIGPSMTLHSVSLALIIWFGFSPENSRLAELCGYGLLAIFVNYISVLAICPSSISLALELLTRCSSSEPPWLLQRVSYKSECTNSNPVIQGVKKIMSAALFTVHSIKWYSGRSVDVQNILNIDQAPPVVRWINSEVENIVLFTVVILLVVYFMIKGSDDDLTEMIKHKGYCSSITVSTQTDAEIIEESPKKLRPVEQSLKMYKLQNGKELTDEEVDLLLREGVITHRSLEDCLKDCSRAVRLRRDYIKDRIVHPEAMATMPYLNYDFSKVKGRCCENVIGYMPIPVGMAGPLRVDGIDCMVPLATIEGALVASTNRGCKALSVNGVNTTIHEDGMTRATLIRLPSAMMAGKVRKWIYMPENLTLLKEAFDSTSNFARLEKDKVSVHISSRLLFIRFVATTGDAMGMNMVAKGAEAAMAVIKREHDDVEYLSISSNLCTDKKHSSINWIMGRGKSIIAECIIPKEVVESVLKTDVAKLVENNIYKNFVGSAMAGSVGGNNCHAANIVAAMFIACGQDAAQVVESSACMTWMEKYGENEDLFLSVTMPSLEVGTVGGGTALTPQMSCLQMLGVQGPGLINGEHSRRLASIIASTVLAGEISLLASLTEGSLVQSHMALNRVKTGL